MSFICTLLIVEDEPGFRHDLVSLIDWAGHGIDIAGAVSNGQEAWALVQRQAPDLILTDIRMPVMDGLELLARVKQAGLETQVILLSGFGEFAYAKQALTLGAFDYLLKPCRPEEILSVVNKAFETHQRRQRPATERSPEQWMVAEAHEGEGALTDPEMSALEAEILQQMQAGRYAQAIDTTALWLEHLRQHPDYSRRQIHLRAIALLLALQRTTQVRKIPAIRWKEELIGGINQLPTVESIEELSTIMTKYLQHVVSILSNHRPVHRTVEAACRIVAAQYQTNLTLEAVAKEVFVSTSYLSTLFKQEMGINFLDYLHQYRIERAKELLGREVLKVFAVAKLVGYQDERHFSSTFKRWTGISPSQFQKSQMPGTN